jgi:hypothetical protein
VTGPVQPRAALYGLEGRFWVFPENATEPAPVIGHEVKLINFNQLPNTPLSLQIQNLPATALVNRHSSPTSTGSTARPTSVRPGWLRLRRGLWRREGQRQRLAFCRRCQWAAGSNPWHGCDLARGGQCPWSNGPEQNIIGTINPPQTAALQREHPNESLRSLWPRSHHISFCMPPRRRHTA